LVLGYHGELQTESGAFPGNDRWKDNPYNVANGGPCETPADFFTNDEAKALYKQRLRLLVARIAGHPHLLAWEFWNEIDHIERRGPVPGDALVAWHEELASYLRSIDPYDHPLTTSISVKAPAGMWELEDLDLVMLHPYGMTDKLTTLLTKTNASYGKPVIAGEFSYSWKPANPGEEADFERELRLGLWRGLMSPTPVLPMTWWWEFHDARDNWRYFQPVSSFSQQMTALNDTKWRALELETANDDIECYGIAVGASRFLWLRNRGESTAANVSIAIRSEASDGYAIRQFNTLTGDAIRDGGARLQVVEGVLTLSVPSLSGGQDTSFVLSR
jgi:hypothetical protein